MRGDRNPRCLSEIRARCEEQIAAVEIRAAVEEGARLCLVQRVDLSLLSALVSRRSAITNPRFLGKPFHRVESATGVTATGIQSRGNEARKLKTSAGLSSARVRGNTTRPSRYKKFQKFPQPACAWGAYV